MSDHLRRTLLKAWTTVVTLYTSSQREGWRLNLLHVFICFLVSLGLNSLLILVLHALKVELLVLLLVCGCSTVIMSGMLIFSKTCRCFSLLFLLACGLKEGRNILLITGASLVWCWSGANTFLNIQKIIQSIMCNLEKKRELLKRSPISNYISIIKWYKEVFESSTFFLSSSVNIDVQHSLQSGNMNEKLLNASREITDKIKGIESVFQIALSFIQRSAPILGILLILFSLALFLRKFIRDKKYMNTFITRKFVLYDERQTEKGKPRLLPLSKQEGQRFITIPCVRPKRAELFPIMMFSIPVCIQIFSWICVIGLDALVYWVIKVFKEILDELKPQLVPLKLKLDGKEKDFSFTMSLFEEDCLEEPTLLITSSMLPLITIIISLTILCFLSAKMMQLKYLVTEQFYPKVADKRVKHLHAKLQKQRSKQNAKDLEKAWLHIVVKDVKFWFPIVDFLRRRADG